MDTHPKTAAPTSAEVDLLVEQAADGVREYVLGQVDLWQQVPNAALRAGIGHNRLVRSAYEYGFWYVGTGSETGLGGRRKSLVVELSSGRLLTNTNRDFRPANDILVLMVWMDRQEKTSHYPAYDVMCFDAQQLLDDLHHTRVHHRAKSWRLNGNANSEEYEDSLRKRFGVTKIHTKPATFALDIIIN
jgi:hypothetical protein